MYVVNQKQLFGKYTSQRMLILWPFVTLEEEPRSVQLGKDCWVDAAAVVDNIRHLRLTSDIDLTLVFTCTSSDTMHVRPQIFSIVEEMVFILRKLLVLDSFRFWPWLHLRQFEDNIQHWKYARAFPDINNRLSRLVNNKLRHLRFVVHVTQSAHAHAHVRALQTPSAAYHVSTGTGTCVCVCTQRMYSHHSH